MKDLTHVLAAVKKERLKFDKKFDNLSLDDKFGYLEDEVSGLQEPPAYYSNATQIEALVHVAAVAIAIVQQLANDTEINDGIPVDIEVFVKDGVFDGQLMKVVTNIHNFNPQKGYPVFECVVPGFDHYYFQAFLKRTIPPPRLQEPNILENIFKSAIEEFETLKAEFKERCGVLENDSVETVAKKIILYREKLK